MLSELPQDVYDSIASHALSLVTDPRPVLVSLNGTNRAFRIAVRPHLFGTVTLALGTKALEDRHKLAREVFEAAQAVLLVREIIRALRLQDKVITNSSLAVVVRSVSTNPLYSTSDPPQSDTLRWLLLSARGVRDMHVYFGDLHSRNRAVLEAWEAACLAGGLAHISRLRISSKSRSPSASTEIAGRLGPLFGRHALRKLQVSFPSNADTTIEAAHFRAAPELKDLVIVGLGLSERDLKDEPSPMRCEWLSVDAPYADWGALMRFAALSNRTLEGFNGPLNPDLVTDVGVQFENLHNVRFVWVVDPAQPEQAGRPRSQQARTAFETLGQHIRTLEVVMWREQADQVTSYIADYLGDSGKWPQLGEIRCVLIKSARDFLPAASNALGARIEWDKLQEVCKERDIEVIWR